MCDWYRNVRIKRGGGVGKRQQRQPVGSKKRGVVDSLDFWATRGGEMRERGRWEGAEKMRPTELDRADRSVFHERPFRGLSKRRGQKVGEKERRDMRCSRYQK